MGKVTSSIKRVLLVARRPTPQEFRESVKISGLIILLVGVVAFLFKILGSILAGVV